MRAIIDRDVRDVARVRNAGDLARLLELLALRTAEPFNASALAGELGVRRDTVDRHVAILERLYLVQRLPAWRRGEARRLITSAKTHLLDSGLAATPAGLTAADWLRRRDRRGTCWSRSSFSSSSPRPGKPTPTCGSGTFETRIKWRST